MEMSSSSAAVLTRPRLAILTAAAAFCVSIYFVHQSRETSVHSEPHGAGLHRSNAVRRHRRRPTNASESSVPDEPQGDENVNINELRMTDGETVAADEQQDDEWWNDPASMPQQRAGQNIVSLLFRVSEDNARRNAYVHRGCMCNACGIVPIRGIRYRCANCADFDLCETCESQGLHIKTHIFYKVKIPAPPFGPRSMQPVWYPGDPDTCLRNLPRTLMVKLSRETGFERPELEAFWEQWTFIANTEWREDPDDLCLAMDRKTFERCLVPSGGHRHTAPNLIHDRMFAFYDTNNDDLIGFTEFLHGLSYRKRKDKLRRIFDGYDVDRDGLVSRRDFLRIFRAYYVLYKQMHRDILEGLDDQVMNSTEAHQLVTSRQPLSSLFGREGRFPQADHGRHMEGKMYHSNGDVTIGDGRDRVVNEDQPDTGDREEILTSLFNHRGNHGLFMENAFSPTSDFQSPNAEVPPHTYFDALLNPPTRVDQLPGLLVGDREPGSMFLSDEDGQQNGEGGRESGSSEDENATSHNETNGEAQEPADQESQPQGIGERRLSEILDRHHVDVQWVDNIPTEAQLRARHQAVVAKSQQAAMNRKTRVAARKRLLERWKRRQFYLDEEEGASPPDGWKDDDDVLASTNGVAESSTTPQILSPRSRSSSKVRFAEDTDDYEIRSNPSTSSRSVPERWGGMDIPDAERDAGKEILYQVTQQAFNELLDVLFKAKEDLAVRAAETKADRDRHRNLFESIDLVEEARKKSELAKTVENGWAEDITVGDESTPLRDRPLEELLDVTGYTVERSREEPSPEEPLPELEIVEKILNDAKDLEEGRNEVTEIENPPSVEPTEESIDDRDPTMPQFRPNSIADLQQSFNVTVPVATDSEMSTPSTDSATVFETWPPGQKWSAMKKTQRQRLKNKPAAPIPHATLVEWKKLDIAEEEAKSRGGWGRLKYHEFEEICRKEESGSNRLDYLGTWIDFCIP